MPKTLLAVDDSATMRKALEITFSGEDYRVVAADSPATAVAKLGEGPSVVIIDTVLAGADGYALCKDVRSKLPKAAIILLSSRYNPYDAGKGQDAGADDFCDKPFDTQQLIDKAKKALATREAGAGAAGPYRAPAAPPPAPVAAPAAAPPAPPPPAPPAPPAAPPAAAPAAAAAASAKPRAATLMFGATGPGGAPAPGPIPRADVPGNATPAVGQPAARPAAPAPAPAAPAASAAPAAPVAAPAASPVAQAVNGAMSAKLGEMGLTKDQADAVLALSRDVIERVVWEVVPQLAETLIKEEIARLTKD